MVSMSLTNGNDVVYIVVNPETLTFCMCHRLCHLQIAQISLQSCDHPESANRKARLTEISEK